MNFDIVDEIKEIETIARGSGIREISRLRKVYGPGNWKKMKGIARFRFHQEELGWPSFIGMRLMVLAKKKLNEKGIWSKL